MLKFSQITKGQKFFKNGFHTLTPKVSIVMPTYCRNAEGLLKGCIDSVINQTFKDFEFIIIDDGSSDGSQQLIESYAIIDPRIVYVRHDINSGFPAVRTDEGILLARSPLIAFIFDDNSWKPDALQILVRAIEETGADMVYGDVEMTFVDDAPKKFGTWPITIETVQLINTIANGGVLCTRLFFEKYGLYDPHLILRRTCDWDLWRRALRFGANIQHVQSTVGVEHGAISPASLGNTVHLDFKVSAAYASDEKNIAERIESLTPMIINEFDVLDPEKVLPYVRDLKEWDDIEHNVYQPLLIKHPDYQYTPPIRHNRRYDLGIGTYALNPPSAVFRKRQRVLLTGNRYNRTMQDWYSALASDPNFILVTCAEGRLPFFSPDEFDIMILFDCCYAGEKIIKEFQQHGASVIYIVDHGLDESKATVTPIQRLHLTNYSSIDSLAMDCYFPAPGVPWPPQIKETALIMIGQSDQAFSIRPGKNNLAQIKFFPNSTDPVVPDDVFPKEAALYLGDPDTINWEHIQILIHDLQPRVGTIYILEGSKLPDFWKSLFSGWNIRVVNDSIFTLIEKLENTCFFVPADTLVNISEYEHLLILEDQIKLKNLIVPIFETMGELDQQTLRNKWLDLTNQWTDITVGYRKDERHQYIRNLVAGITLRKKIAVMHGKPRAVDIRSTVLINSLLFGGSESYGLMLSEKLRELGFDITIVGPLKDVYGSGTKKINHWLEDHHFPVLTQLEYGTAAYQLFSQTPDEKEAIHSSKELDKWFENEKIDLIFCSGFIAEPAIANSPHRIVYMALFPPWGYNLANMTFLKNKISGLFSDTRWGLDFWRSWFPTPSEVTPSLVDSEYFQVLNKELPDKPISLAVMGTIIHTKRQREAILALRQLVLEGYDLQLNIYGHILDVYKNYIDELMELLRDPILSGRVKLHGFVADPHQVARENHIILSTSIAEGLPQALILNQASGLLPVACPAGGIPEVVLDGETGFLADGFEVEHIIIALRRALQNQADWQKLIFTGRELLLNTSTGSEFMRRIIRTMITGADIKKSEGAHLFTNFDFGKVKIGTKHSSVLYGERRIGPTLANKKLTYTLKVEKDGLQGFSFQPGTYATQPKGTIKIAIYLKSQSKSIREVNVDLSTLRDNQWGKINFDPILDSSEKVIRIEVTPYIEDGIVALYERFPENQKIWNTFFLRIERRLNRYLTIRHKRPSYAFVPIYD